MWYENRIAQLEAINKALVEALKLGIDTAREEHRSFTIGALKKRREYMERVLARAEALMPREEVKP